MITAITITLAVLMFPLGFIAGRNRRPRRIKPVRPVCGCEHELAYHDPASGQCHKLVKGKEIKWDDEDPRYARGWERVQCQCRRYTGPQPLPEYYAPEITS